MATSTKIAVLKKEYSELQEKAKLYDVIKELVFQTPFFEKPAIKNTKEILRELGKTGKYNQNFLKSIKKACKNRLICSFRITRAYRVIFVYIGNDTIEIIDINNHYK